MSLFHGAIGVGLSTLMLAGSALAGVPKDLPYPTTGDLTADQVADQVYFVNHFYANKNYSIQKKGRKVTVLLNKTKGSDSKVITLTRYLNNDYSDGIINARDMALFHSGKLKGTGMLVTDYVDDAKSQAYAIWLPALRKIRRFAEPAHDDSWGGSDFTFGDVTLRKPYHETHELLGKETFNDCLGTIKDVKKTKYTSKLRGPKCIKDREVYKLKSTTKFQNWWYDYRVSYVDAETFADHRTEYFKDGTKVKVIDRAWGSFGDADKRNQYWEYWYGTTLDTGHETWAVIPEGVSVKDADLDANYWSEKTLRKIKR
ncbi:MAG: outer membrane lipoprotein-sorting protein [Gammaproteobacteria bacterium]|nr:outer membrane lipoprotein-sorting protein [Gammaproteobacteria bacterium]